MAKLPTHLLRRVQEIDWKKFDSRDSDYFHDHVLPPQACEVGPPWGQYWRQLYLYLAVNEIAISEMESVRLKNELRRVLEIETAKELQQLGDGPFDFYIVSGWRVFVVPADRE